MGNRDDIDEMSAGKDFGGKPVLLVSDLGSFCLMFFTQTVYPLAHDVSRLDGFPCRQILAEDPNPVS